jgi:hypothetical protein
MRTLRMLPALLLFVCLAGVRPAAGALQSYELVPGSGQLTAVHLGTDETTNLLASPVAINDAEVTADFDPLNSQLSNLFIAVNGPGVINLGANTLTFSDATLQSSAATLTFNSGAYNFEAAATIKYSLDGGATFNTISGAPSGTMQPTADGLKIFVDGVNMGFLPNGTQIKADFAFNAQRVDGSTAIPEPGSQFLLPAGLALLGWALRTRKQPA